MAAAASSNGLPCLTAALLTQIIANEVDFSLTESTGGGRAAGFATDSDISRGTKDLFGRKLEAVDNSWLENADGAYCTGRCVVGVLPTRRVFIGSQGRVLCVCVCVCV